MWGCYRDRPTVTMFGCSMSVCKNILKMFEINKKLGVRKASLVILLVGRVICVSRKQLVITDALSSVLNKDLFLMTTCRKTLISLNVQQHQS